MLTIPLDVECPKKMSNTKGSTMIIRFIKQLMRAPALFVMRYKARNLLTQLVSHADPTLNAIGAALQETLDQIFSKQEQEFVSLIEQRRALLLKSDQEIAVVDFGAGAPDSNRTKEQMDHGIQSTAAVAEVASASKSQFWAVYLFKLIRKLKPASCVELGSCVGISAAYQAKALYLNEKGSIVSLEGSPEIAKIAEKTFEDLAIQNASIITGPFQQTLQNVLESAKPIDFFFNDGHHDHDAVIQYFEEAFPYLSDGAVIVFDDISWSPGMKRAWAEIENDQRIFATINHRKIGIAVVNKKAASAKVHFRIPL